MTDRRQRGFAHVPALDGVRALSVVGILLFHGSVRWARGGFLGVTVFFTLSGFLITSLLLTERERTGRIRLGDFWVRRARRLAPGVLVLLALVAGLLATGRLASRDGTLGDAVATAGWGANWRFVLSGQSYADLFSQPSPFQHMWSLAVEEQFYLVFPGLLLLLLGRSERVHRWRAGLFVLGAIGASTAALALLFAPGATERAYYGTDTRIAEPLVGVLLALLLTRGGTVRALPRAARHLADVAALAALVGLGYLVWTLGQYSHELYHGALLLVAALTAVVLTGVTQQGSLVGAVLSLRPLTWLGKVSYGVYLFHWPVFLWLTQQRTGLSPWPLLSLRCAVTLAIAAVSYLLIEEPVRRAKRFHVSIAVPAWANATVLAMAALVLATGSIAAVPSTHHTDQVSASGPVGPVVTQAPTKRLPRAAARPTTAPRPRAGTSRAVRPSTRTTATAGPTRRPTASSRPTTTPSPAPRRLRVAVVGDSLADNLGKGMRAWAGTTSNVEARNYSLSGCPIALGGMRRWPDGYESEVRAECSWFTDHGTARWKDFAAFDPDVVVMQDGMNELVERKLDQWNSYRSAGDPVFDTWMLEQYRSALEAFNPDGTRSVLLLNAVCADWDRVSHFQGFQLELDRRVDALNLDYGQLSARGLVLEDFDAHLCPNGKYTDTVDGVPNGRYDGYHLTADAEVAVARQWLGPLCLGAGKR